MPQMLRDIIEGALKSEPDMELLDSGDGAQLAAAVRRDAADVAIIADRQGAGSPAQLLVDNPHLKVFVIADDGRRAHLVALRCTTLVEVSVQGLIDAIRATAANGSNGSAFLEMRRGPRGGS